MTNNDDDQEKEDSNPILEDSTIITMLNQVMQTNDNDSDATESSSNLNSTRL